jgi:hypothetical protein
VIQGDDCVVEADQTIESNVLALCQTFTHNGTIKGDLFLAAFSAEINGPVEGNIYTLAGQLDVRDRIGRDLIFAGPVLRVHSTTRFSDTRSGIISLGLSTEIAAGAKIPGSIVNLGYQLTMAGEVGREVSFWGSALTINGQVSGDVDASVGDPQASDHTQLQTLLVPFRFDIELIPPGLVVTEQAQIEGRLTYTSIHEGTIEGQMAQSPVFNQNVTTPVFNQINLDEESNAAWLTNYLSVTIREFITLAVIGAAAVFFLPRPIQTPLQHLRARPLSSLGVGILTFILSFAVWLVILLIFVLLIIIFLTFRLADLAFISLMAVGMLNIGGAGAFYFVAIYISRIIVCLFVGRVLVRVALGDDGTPRMLYLNLLAGVAALSILGFLPFIGGIVNALALAFGLGAIFITVTQWRAISRRQPVTVPLPSMPGAMRQIPPPPISEEKQTGPGMQNLPEGFEWWNNEES